MKNLLAAGAGLAAILFFLCVVGLFPAFIMWAICDGHGFLPYSLAALAPTSYYAKVAAKHAQKTESPKQALFGWIPFALNCILIYVVWGEIASCH
ncbi:MAG: hypothetical protein JSS58_02950 [Proteobacteria bacterium]|nr:hypothetical protein [Pseudomonadota bacterium]